MQAIHIFAAVSAVDALVLWLFLKDAPKTTGGSHFRGRSIARRIFFDRGFWILGYAQFVRYGVQNLVLTWASLFLVEAFGLPLWTAGAALSATFAVTMLSDPVGGVISDRVGRIWVLYVSLVGLSGLITALALNKNVIVLWLLLAGIGWFVAFYRGTIFAMVPERYGVETTGSVSGAHNTFAAIGAFAVPLLFGYLRDISGNFALGWLLAAGLLLTAAMLVPVLRSSSQGMVSAQVSGHFQSSTFRKVATILLGTKPMSKEEDESMMLRS